MNFNKAARLGTGNRISGANLLGLPTILRKEGHIRGTNYAKNTLLSRSITKRNPKRKQETEAIRFLTKNDFYNNPANHKQLLSISYKDQGTFCLYLLAGYRGNSAQPFYIYSYIIENFLQYKQFSSDNIVFPTSYIEYNEKNLQEWKYTVNLTIRLLKFFNLIKKEGILFTWNDDYSSLYDKILNERTNGIIIPKRKNRGLQFEYDIKNIIHYLIHCGQYKKKSDFIYSYYGLTAKACSRSWLKNIHKDVLCHSVDKDYVSTYLNDLMDISITDNPAQLKEKLIKAIEELVFGNKYEEPCTFHNVDITQSAFLIAPIRKNRKITNSDYTNPQEFDIAIIHRSEINKFLNNAKSISVKNRKGTRYFDFYVDNKCFCSLEAYKPYNLKSNPFCFRLKNLGYFVNEISKQQDYKNVSPFEPDAFKQVIENKIGLCYNN